MALSTQPYKGARDFYPEDMRLQKHIFGKWREVCERYGYQEYDAPILEPTELYLNKGNEEIINEQTYTFKDRGDRSLTMRTEMTPTVTRMVAGRRQELAYPLRWYSIPQCWRYERMQRGRGREFYQLNADIFGEDGLPADYEIIAVADDVMRAFGAKRTMYSIKVNSRLLSNYILEKYIGLDGTQAASAIRLIDKMHKMEPSEFTALLDAIMTPSQREAGMTEKLLAVLQATTMDQLPDQVKQQPAALKLMELMNLVSEQGMTNAEYDVTLMRGFDYYTDMVFEVFDTHPDNNRSMYGGGRYDGLSEMFGVEPIPVVGFAMGDMTLANFLELHELLPTSRPETEVYVALIGDVYEPASKVATELRKMGLNVAIDGTGRQLDKQIKAAVKLSIPYVMFVGNQELSSGQYKLKYLKTGVEESHTLERIVSIVKDYRH